MGRMLSCLKHSSESLGLSSRFCSGPFLVTVSSDVCSVRFGFVLVSRDNHLAFYPSVFATKRADSLGRRLSPGCTAPPADSTPGTAPGEGKQ